MCVLPKPRRRRRRSSSGDFAGDAVPTRPLQPNPRVCHRPTKHVQVAGLWVMLAIGLLAASLLLFAMWAGKRSQSKIATTVQRIKSSKSLTAGGARRKKSEFQDVPGDI